ncbi:MAG: M61 family metallopeptidase [Flavobacteriales bacterium]
MRIFIIILSILVSQPLFSASINYEVNMSEPHTHYFEVIISITDYKKDYFDIQMPVWAPGSYLIREFSKNVENFKSFSNSKEIKFTQLNKNTWRIFSNNATDIKVSYLVYANEMSVRTSFIDASHGYFNGSSMFMFIDELKNSPTNLTIHPYKDWKKVSTSLKKTADNGFKYEAPNFDILVDSPVEIGNHETFSFTAAGVTHHVAMYGKGNYDIEKLKIDMSKVIEAATDVFGENPNTAYTFIIHNLTKGSGGLEHLSSTTLQVNRWTYQGEDYKGFLSLVAHEYFHLWNVKRIRPDVLGPFDYNNENYTDLLWVMEGFTSYYDELLLYRAGIYTEEEIIRKFSGSINSIENQPGNKVMSAAESSFNAWIKGYRPNENSYNTSISYYTKGSVIANMLDLMIAESTKGKKSLDDVMKFLYQEYYKKQNRGFNITEMRTTVEKISGLDLEPFFDKYIFGTETFDYKTVFGYANYDMLIMDNKRINMGVSLSNNYIKSVTRNTSSYSGGLNVGDEILAVNGFRFDGSFSEFTNNKKVGDKISVLISRDDIIQTIEVPLIESSSTSHNLIKKDEPENAVYKKWLRKL